MSHHLGVSDLRMLLLGSTCRCAICISNNQPNTRIIFSGCAVQSSFSRRTVLTMPTTAKLEKQSSTENGEPIRMGLVVLEHKIRNLEKRKRKIEIYREDQSKGQTLNSDQLLAVSKYDEVTKNLDFAQDLHKQFLGIANESNKNAKKQLRKEALERAAQDVSKVKDILMIQDILQGMGQDNVREDFLAGRNNAILLTNDDLKYLDDLYLEVAPKRPTPDDGLPPFGDQLTAAAELLLNIVEGKQKDVVGTSHEYLKQLFARIQDCGYFDQQTDNVVPFETNVPAADAVEEVLMIIEAGEELMPIAAKDQQFVQAAMPPAPLAKSLPIPSNLVPAPATAAVTAATTSAPIEAAYFATNTHSNEAINYNSVDQQQSVNELIKTVSGSFNFLQESELDTPGLDSVVVGAVPLPASNIPSQTYTNQSFSGVPAPAVVAPLPQVQPAVYPVGVAEMNQPIAGFAAVNPNPPPPIPMPPTRRSNPYAAGADQAAPARVAAVRVPPTRAAASRATPAHADFHQEQQQQQQAPTAGEGIHGMPRVEPWGALGDATVSTTAGSSVGGGEWNPEAAQAAGEWAMPSNEGQPHRPVNPRPGHRGNRGGSRGASSSGAYASRGQSRQGNFHNGNRNAGNFSNYPRSQEGHTGATSHTGTGIANASYYQHQNGYQQHHSQAQQPQQQQQQQQQQQPAQANREHFNTNGNYTSYRTRPTQRAPGTRSTRGGMANDGGVSNQRAARGTAFVGGGGGGGRPQMNRQ